jgi:hypothetical protein
MTEKPGWGASPHPNTLLPHPVTFSDALSFSDNCRMAQGQDTDT